MKTLCPAHREGVPISLPRRLRILIAMLLCFAAVRASLAIAQTPAGPSPASHRQDGLRYLQQREPQKALEHFRAAVTIDPKDFEAQFYVGAILLELGQTPDAIAELQRAVNLNGGSHLGHYYLGLALDKSGRTVDALDQYQHSLRLKPEFDEARYSLSSACWKLGDLDGAILLLREVVAGKPDFAEARFNLGLALKQNGELDEAIKELQTVCRLPQPHPGRTWRWGRRWLKGSACPRRLTQCRRLPILRLPIPSIYTTLALRSN
jgi:tetratricopeptide (TPR) repeat protein